MSGRAHTVENGKLLKTSVSALKTFGHTPDEKVQSSEGCNLRWWFKYVQRKPEPETTAQTVGTAVHEQIERYLKFGQDTLGAIAREALSRGFIPKPERFYLPSGKKRINPRTKKLEEVFVAPPGADLLVEEHFGAPSPLTAAGVPFDGYIDLVNLRRLSTNGIVEITDWKTSGNINDDRYEYGESDLTTVMKPHGVQMLAYAEWVKQSPQRFPGVKGFTLRHVKIQTKGKRDAKEVKTVAPVTLTTVTHEWDSLVRRVEAMKVVAATTDVKAVPVNTKACGAYGGCPHASYCPAKKIAARVVAGFTNNGVNGMSLIKKVLKPTSSLIPQWSAAPAAPAAPLGYKPAPPTPQVTTTVMIGEGGKPVVTGAAPAANPLLVTVRRKIEIIDVPDDAPATAHPQSIVAPDAPKSDPKKAAEPITAEHAAQLDPEVRAHIEAQGMVVNGAAEQVTEETSADAPKRRGRPKGLTKDKQKSLKNGDPIDTVIARRNEEEGLGKVVSTQTALNVRLYIDCVPSHPVKRLDSYIAERCADVCEAAGEPDIRLIEFGKGKGILATLVREEPPAAGEYVVFSGDVSNVVIEALLPSVEYVRGLGR